MLPVYFSFGEKIFPVLQPQRNIIAFAALSEKLQFFKTCHSLSYGRCRAAISFVLFELSVKQFE